MRKGLVIAATVIVAIVLSASFLVAENLTGSSPKPTPVYVGVTYCGNNVTEAKLLIDRVKSYTNLFVKKKMNNFFSWRRRNKLYKDHK